MLFIWRFYYSAKNDEIYILNIKIWQLYKMLHYMLLFYEMNDALVYMRLYK